MLKALVLAGLVVLTGAAPRAPDPGWTEIAWPFPRDAWPAGRAFRCGDCDLVVAVRPKIGFCNCGTGVRDDAEVDAVSDMDMISEAFTAPAPGEWIELSGLRGRVRDYVMPSGQAASGYALSSDCDVLVAAALGRDAADRSRVAGLLETEPLKSWVAAKLGRGPIKLTPS